MNDLIHAVSIANCAIGLWFAIAAAKVYYGEKRIQKLRQANERRLINDFAKACGMLAAVGVPFDSSTFDGESWNWSDPEHSAVMKQLLDARRRLVGEK